MDIAADLVYFGLTTFGGYQTLGEEYVNLIQVDSSLHRVPSQMWRGVMILMHTVAPYFLDRLLAYVEAKAKSGNTSPELANFQHLFLHCDMSSPLYTDVTWPHSICMAFSITFLCEYQEQDTFKFGKAVVTYLDQITSCWVGCLLCNSDSHFFIIFTVYQSLPMKSFTLVLPYWLGFWLCLHPTVTLVWSRTTQLQEQVGSAHCAWKLGNRQQLLRAATCSAGTASSNGVPPRQSAHCAENMPHYHASFFYKIMTSVYEYESYFVYISKMILKIVQSRSFCLE